MSMESNPFNSTYDDIIHAIAKFGQSAGRAQPEDLPELKNLRSAIAGKLEAEICNSHDVLSHHQAGDYENITREAVGYGWVLQNAAERLYALSEYGVSVEDRIEKLENEKASKRGKKESDS